MRLSLRIGRDRPSADFYETADRLRKWECYRVQGREYDVPESAAEEFKREVSPYKVTTK